MSRSVDLHNHYLNGGVPVEVAENLKDLPEHDGLSYEEFLLQQESVYQSFQEHGKNKGVATDDDHSGDWSHLLEEAGQSSRCEKAVPPEAWDEAFARQLELGEGEELDELLLSEHSGSASGGSESPIATPPRAQAVSPDLRQEQDNVDPDNMSYEEMRDLTETVGVESRGLTTARISRLPTSMYRTGMFSKNKKKEENCVICQRSFNFAERLITLPCSHQYHVECISKWLKLNKICPICLKEVE